MCHHPLLVMSLSGSVVVALYALLYPVIKRYVSISWQRVILKAAIFFFLFPLPLFKEAFVSFISDLFPVFAEKMADIQEVGLLDLNYAINLEPGNVFFGSEVLLVGIFICGMGIITSFAVIRQLKQYFALSQFYLSTAFSEAPSSCLMEQFKQTKEDLKINRKVRFVCSPLCKTPVTIGAFSPMIVFPTEDIFRLEPASYAYVMKHELLHIKNGDYLIKILSLLVLALHWYNPVCYFLYREICIVCEMNCDHEMIRESDEALRQIYSNLILDLATNNQFQNEKYVMGLVNGNLATFERRILEMKTNRRSKRIVSIAIIFAICLAGSLTAFAYEAPQTYKITEFDPTEEHMLSFSSSAEDVSPIPYNLFFTDKEGHVYPLDMTTPKLGCKHKLVEGTLSDHQKKSNGSCVTIVRKAWRCSLCGYLEADEVISEMKYTVCPH